MGNGEKIVRRQSLKDQVLALLRKRLTVGEMEPGRIYSAQALAQELGVSSTPVREALLELVVQRSMEPVKNRGFRVREMSAKERADLHELRHMIEIPAMMKLIEIDIPPKEVERLHAIVDALVLAARDQDFVTYFEEDRRFHVGIMNLLGNSQLTPIVDSLRARTRSEGLITMAETEMLVHTAREHHAILDAVVTKDRERLLKLLEAHMELLAPPLATGSSKASYSEPYKEPVPHFDDLGNELKGEQPEMPRVRPGSSSKIT